MSSLTVRLLDCLPSELNVAWDSLSFITTKSRKALKDWVSLWSRLGFSATFSKLCILLSWSNHFSSSLEEPFNWLWTFLLWFKSWLSESLMNLYPQRNKPLRSKTKFKFEIHKSTEINWRMGMEFDLPTKKKDEIKSKVWFFVYHFQKFKKFVTEFANPKKKIGNKWM